MPQLLILANCVFSNRLRSAAIAECNLFGSGTVNASLCTVSEKYGVLTSTGVEAFQPDEALFISSLMYFGFQHSLNVSAKSSVKDSFMLLRTYKRICNEQE